MSDQTGPKPSQHVPSRAQMYYEINSRKPREYWDYESYDIEWGKTEGYELIRRIGRGRYSEVFEGISTTTDDKCVIKTLKPVRYRKITREVKILENLRGGVNIISFVKAVRHTVDKPALIFEYVEKTDFESLCETLTDIQVRYYMFELLRALNYCHSMGIMHRDVKPNNFVINHTKKVLKLIDWGMADFYHPKKEYNVKVASRYFKAPELLVGYGMYDYSLDMWSYGCVVASLIFKKEPFFCGFNNDDQLVQIVKVLGTTELFEYLRKYNISIPTRLKKAMKTHSKKSWSRYVKPENTHLVSAQALEFVDKLLKIDHQKRMTSLGALNHSYFDAVVAENKRMW